ncbi:hypothetical protein HD806DRAFT_547610 [Xylariaceae sp. AK1471]|nr:hypothetical protein HD806DRAFT_547610 [Xylariaceae sp. AK1471]
MKTISDTSSQYPVYVGVWTNWSRGHLLGTTLTLERQDSDLLIAFIAFFIAFVGSRAWRILCFIFHRACSTPNPQNVIYYQHQAILRNVSSAEDGIVLLLKIMWANRRSRRGLRPLVTVLVAAFCVAVFTVAGGYSSRISTAIGNEVLIKKCYLNSTASLLECARFVTKKIVGSIDEKAPCPFKDVLCRANSANLRIDTGFLSSHDHLGLNTPADRRILWRNVLHCGPLATKDFTSQKNTSFGEATLYHYGSIKSIQYSISELAYFIMLPPIDSIDRRDADIYFLFLSGNGVTFQQPSEDIWYRVAAAPPNGAPVDANETTGRGDYYPLEPASPMGCADQYQFCVAASPGASRCGPLASLADAVAGAAPLFDTTYDDIMLNAIETDAAAFFSYFVKTAFPPDQLAIDTIVNALGPTSLLSQSHLFHGVQVSLEPNEWQLDMAHLWDITMAVRQASFLDTAYGPTSSADLAERLNFTSSDLKNFCNNQKIRSTAYASFSLFWLIFTFVIGMLFILISYAHESIFEILYGRGYEHYNVLYLKRWASALGPAALTQYRPP